MDRPGIEPLSNGRNMLLTTQIAVHDLFWTVYLLFTKLTEWTTINQMHYKPIQTSRYPDHQLQVELPCNEKRN